MVLGPTPLLGITQIEEGQTNADLLVNLALRFLEQGAQVFNVKDTTATPPGSPVDGDSYRLAASPTGLWASFAQHDLVFWDADAALWRKFSPASTMQVWVWDETAAQLDRWTGTAYVKQLKQSAAVVDLTDNSGGTATDTIAVIGATYDQAEVRDAIASLAAKVNELIAAQQEEGVMAT